MFPVSEGGGECLIKHILSLGRDCPLFATVVYRINLNKRAVCHVVKNSLPWERAENHSKTREVEKKERKKPDLMI